MAYCIICRQVMITILKDLLFNDARGICFPHVVAL